MPVDNKAHKAPKTQEVLSEVAILTIANQNLERYSSVRKLSLFMLHITLNSPLSNFSNGPQILKAKSKML